jgi:acyl-CoA synthetase (AMP-forming)/AMP-acid ligase II
MNLSMLLDVAHGLSPEHVAASDGARSLTLAQLREASLSVAHELARTERPGPLAFLDVNSTALPIALFGAAYAGHPFAPLNFRADQALIDHYLDVLAPAVVIVGSRYAPLVPPELRWNPRSLDGECGTNPSITDDASEPAVQIFTSGTTSAPKAAALSHENLLAYVLNTTEPLSDAAGASLVAAPNYHIATVMNLLTSVYSGRRLVFLERFRANEWLQTARAEAVTHAFVVPTMLQRLVGALEGGAPRPDVLRTVAYGGSAAFPATIEAALKLFSPETGFVNAYGLTETSSTVSLLNPDDHRAAVESADPHVRARLSSVGRPLPGIEVAISDESEILVRGPQVSGAYHGDGERSDGWFHTGDLGRLDDDGYLFIEGRMDDLIIRGGENISPTEIEAVIRESPEVSDAAVVGVADLEWGQRVAAAVELLQPLDPETLADRLAGRLPSFKRPEQIIVVDELPRTDLGKLKRRAVREWFERPCNKVNGKDER